jgi:nicotinate-nucleotide adenylyltransferase
VKSSERLMVDDREIHREGASYTIDTLRSLRQEFPDNPLYLLMGTDAYIDIQTWHEWEQLLALTHIVVMQRPDEKMSMSAALSEWHEQHLAVAGDNVQLAGKIWPVAVTQLAISATTIRSLLSQGKSPQFLLPDAVLQLIQQLQLYPSDEL